MTWLLFSLLAAFSESLKDTFGKLSSVKTDEYTSAFSLHFFSLIFVLPFIIYTGIPVLTNEFWLGSSAFLIITPIWSLLYMKALKISEVSKVIPLMAFNPLFTGLLAYWFTEQTPSMIGWMGIGLITFGIYIANIDRATFNKDLLSPIKNIFADPGALAMLAVAVLWSFGAHFGKMRVNGSSALFSTFTGGLIGMVTTYLLAIIRGKSIKIDVLYNNKWNLMPVGVFYFLANILSSFALVTGSAAYVFATKRASIAGSLFSGKFVFNEVLSLTKVVGTILICAGVLFLAVG